MNLDQICAAKVICADAREPSSYERALAGERADLLLTDPPYCLLTRRRKGGDLRDPKGRKIERGPLSRFESVRDYRSFTQAWLPHAVEHLTRDAVLVIWTNFLGKEPILNTAATLGYTSLWGEFVWAKRGTERAGNELLLRVYEVALVLSYRPPPERGHQDASLPWSVVAGYDDDGEAARYGGHPNHKPFGVLEPLIRNFSSPESLVLDPFGGSGSIGAAALALGRRAAVIEREVAWASIIDKRLAACRETRASGAIKDPPCR